MFSRSRVSRIATLGCLVVLGAGSLALLPGAIRAQPTAPEARRSGSLEEIVSAAVRVRTFIDPEARTRESLGREREGSGIVIDEGGLVLTIGYLMVEAHAAEVTTNAGHRVPADVVGYDHETGFGLLRAVEPLKVKPLGFGKSADVREGDPVLVASFGGMAGIQPAYVASKRPFAGGWEYLLDEAIFTAPPYAQWSGAALISRGGKLLGVGSLLVKDATGKNDERPGNMFVPADLLAPILADLLADGRRSGDGRPWLGMTTSEIGGRLLVARVTPDGPAAKAGVQNGDVILGVDGEKADSLAGFYRQVWTQRSAGSLVPLDISRAGDTRRLEIRSINRLDHLRLRSTF